MRLLDTETGQFLEIAKPTDKTYAILSHTWDGQEQTYEELRDIQAAHEPPKLLEKIRGACGYARANGHRYIWIDSCCIDKSSSAELSEAINAMYKWYQFAAVCYVFLSDVAEEVRGDEDRGDFYYSRWHTRGWTLQELLAPAAVVFLSKDWRYLGTKLTLARQLEYRLNIPYIVLTHMVALETFNVAERFAWAADRETTRVEGRAYCLLGLFGANMPLLYGEGDRAFYRLQQAIWAQTADHTIFAWTPIESTGVNGMQAWGPGGLSTASGSPGQVPVPTYCCSTSTPPP
ncbi:HET-domain-containing protein [Cubamyces sp. BRFM 1775]|nr:HET-domain-containing protein [Cubamyces sp. BRFM 1775]